MAVRFFYLAIYLIEGIIFLQYCSVLFRSKFSRLFDTALILVLYTAQSFLPILGSSLINLISFLVGNFLFLFFAYRVAWHTALFHAVISTTMMSVCELLVLAISPLSITVSFNDWSALKLWLIPATIGKIIYFLVMHLFANFSSRKGTSNGLFDRELLILTVIPAASIFIIHTFMLLCNEADYSLVINRMIATSSVLLLALNLVIWELYHYTQERNQKLSETQLSLQKESDLLAYYQMLIQQDEDQRKFIHDIKKHLQSIALLNEKGDSEKVSSYIASLIGSSILSTSSRICGNDFLNALLCRYTTICMRKKISLRADIRNNSVDFLSENEMTSLFCNLLDNAVAASSQMPDSFIELSACCREGTSFTIITMINSCRRPPAIQHNNQIVVKTRHGYGLKIIERIVKAHNGEIQHYYSENNHTFHTIVTLKNS